MKSKSFSLCAGAVAVLIWLLIQSMPAHAQSGGTQIVFDPQMFARQLSQLQQETATVTNLSQQLQYMVRNTTGDGAGVWQSMLLAQPSTACFARKAASSRCRFVMEGTGSGNPDSR